MRTRTPETRHRAVRLLALAAAGSLLLALSPAARGADTAASLLAAYTAQAGKPASAERGEAFFNAKRQNDFDWSCSSCHTTNPTGPGRDQTSDKRIPPLAPGANPRRFNDKLRVDNWFRNNCKDVIGRECTAAEKADVLAWLISLK